MGFVSESVETFKNGFELALNLRSTSDDMRPTFESGHRMASAIEQQLDDMRTRVDRINNRLDMAMPLFAATSSSSVTMVNSIAPESHFIRFQSCPFDQVLTWNPMQASSPNWIQR